jgi:hypothetical protein
MNPVTVDSKTGQFSLSDGSIRLIGAVLDEPVTDADIARNPELKGWWRSIQQGHMTTRAKEHAA